MRFQPVKCNMMQLTRKRIKKIHASYTLEGTDLENVESIKYLGVTITSDLYIQQTFECSAGCTYNRHLNVQLVVHTTDI